MAIRIMPQARIEPVRSQTGGASGSVEPVRGGAGVSNRLLSEGLQDVGRAATVAADRYQDEVDRTMSERMRNLYDAEAEKEMADPQGGFLTTVGMHAADPERRKQTFDRLRATRQRIEGMAQNGAQNANFAEHANRVDEQSVALADRHQAREMRTWKAGETRVAAETGIKRGIQFFGTEEGEVQVAVAMKKLEEWGKLVGYGPEQIEQEKQQAKDALHAGRIDQLVSNNFPAQAHAYFQDMRGDMTPDAAARASRYVERAVLDHVSRNVAQGAFAQAEQERRSMVATSGAYPIGTQPSDVDLDAADAEWISQRVYSIVDENQSLTPDQRAASTQRIAFVQRRQDEVRAGRKNTVRSQSEQWLMDNQLARASDLPPQLFVPAQRMGLLPGLDDFATNKRRMTKTATYDHLRSMTNAELSELSDQQFEAMFRGGLDNTDYAYGKSLHRVATGQSDSGDADAVTWRDKLEKFSRDLKVLPESGTASGPQKAADYALRREIQKRLDARAAKLTGGKKLTDEDRQQVLDEAARDKAFVDRSFMVGDTVQNVIAMTPEQMRDAYVQVAGEDIYLRDIPDAERQKIIESLQARGRPVSQQAIAELWVRAGKPKP